MLRSLDSGDEAVLIRGGSDARYVPTGHIAYAVDHSILGVPFDVDCGASVARPSPSSRVWPARDSRRPQLT